MNAMMGLCLLFYTALVATSLLLGALGVVPIITALLLIGILIANTISIPLQLAWERRENYRRLVGFFAFNMLYSVAIYSLIYWRHGLIHNGVHRPISLIEALYFSITTWTTLGYGDFQPAGTTRLVTSLEALNGFFALSIFIALVAIWLNESLRALDTYVANLPQLANEAKSWWKDENPEIFEKIRDLDRRFEEAKSNNNDNSTKAPPNPKRDASNQQKEPI